MEGARVDLGVLLRQAVEAVERVERAAANEKCARRRHRIHCTETGLVVGLLDNPAVKLLKQQILADKLIQERSL
jgi:hypothetical protein